MGPRETFPVREDDRTHHERVTIAFHNLALLEEDVALSSRYVVAQAQSVLASRGCIVNHEALEHTRLNTDFHDYSPTFRALLDQPHAFVRHQFEQQESIAARTVTSGTITLRNPHDQGIAIMSIAPTAQGGRSINLWQALRRKALAQAEPLQLDEAAASGILTDIIRQTGVDPRDFNEVRSLDGLCDLLTTVSPTSCITRAGMYPNMSGNFASNNITITEQTKHSRVVRPVTEYEITLSGLLQYAKSEDAVARINLTMGTHAEEPFITAGLRMALAVAKDAPIGVAERNRIINTSLAPYQDADRFINVLHRHLTRLVEK